MKRGWATGKISAVMQQEKYHIKSVYTADLCVQKQCSVSSPNSLTVCVHLLQKSLQYFFLILQLIYMDVSKVSEASRGWLKKAVFFCSCYRHKYTPIPIITQPRAAWAVDLIQMQWVLLWVGGWAGALSSLGTKRISGVTPLAAKKHI